ITQPITQSDSPSLDAETTVVRPRASTDSLRVSQTALSGASITDTTQRKLTMILDGTAAILVLIELSFGLYLWWRWYSPAPIAGLKIIRITASGKASNAAISPDGKYIVHVVTDGGLQALDLRQVSTNTNQEILAPADVVYSGLTFSKD